MTPEERSQLEASLAEYREQLRRLNALTAEDLGLPEANRQAGVTSTERLIAFIEDRLANE